MFWTFDYQGKEYISWGQPRSLPKEEVSNIKSRFDLSVYQGEEIKRGESVLYSMQGDATLGMGDSIWLMTYLREIYNIKGRRRCQLDVATSESIAKFYSNFLPNAFNFIDEYVLKEDFDKYDHVLPAMYYWKDKDEADRSWNDNKSILERLYNLVGVEYCGLPDWSDFTPHEILNPPDDYYEKLGIKKEDRYVFFQWHSSGIPKNLPPKSNIKLLQHITKKYGLKCYVIGRLTVLDDLEKIPGVINLSNKTTAEDVFSLAANAEFIVCPDSAGVHLSEAYRVPGVAIMSTLPPVYIAHKYEIPAFMFGSGFCPFRPCGVVTHLPLKDKCPPGTKNYCAVLEDIDLEVFDNCLTKSFSNRENYRKTDTINFYQSMSLPIVPT